MPLKLNISNKGKSWKLEVEPEALSGKSIGDTIKGAEISPAFAGYELEITGGTDFAGFPLSKNIEGIGLKKVLLTKGWGMHKRPKGLKKKPRPTPKGLRLKKTVRGKTISEKVIQVNIKVLKEGSKKLENIFPEQNKAPEKPKAEEPKQEVATPTQ